MRIVTTSKSQPTELLASFVRPVSFLNVVACSDGLPLAPMHFEGVNLAVIIADDTRDETLGLLSIAGSAARAAGAVVLVLLADSVHSFLPENLLVELDGCIDALVALPRNPSASTVHAIVQAYLEACGTERSFALPTGAEFLDLRAVFANGDQAFMAVATAAGVDRTKRTAKLAASKIASRLQCATGFFVAVAGNRILSLEEISHAASVIHGYAPFHATGSLAGHYDSGLQDAVRVTVIATVSKLQ
ncbi:hypothetical protein [Burkholderia sp. Bp9131]|uniref:hypothetical protein n=1 Tax=Burkholderia sp. Bp9131 TaxID=2184571 RepID=UPI00162320BA|nr:hypothetical protein [Burkholderia sp. Bp9131]